MTTVVYHLQKVYSKSGWKVDGTPLRSFQWKLSGSNEASVKLVLFSRSDIQTAIRVPFLQS